MMSNKWSRIEEADDILDECLILLGKIPLSDLKKGHMWVPSSELVNSLVDTKERIYRYMKRNHLLYDHRLESRNE